MMVPPQFAYETYHHRARRDLEPAVPNAYWVLIERYPQNTIEKRFDFGIILRHDGKRRLPNFRQAAHGVKICRAEDFSSEEKPWRILCWSIFSSRPMNKEGIGGALPERYGALTMLSDP
jgi:hypothetical protein